MVDTYTVDSGSVDNYSVDHSSDVLGYVIFVYLFPDIATVTI